MDKKNDLLTQLGALALGSRLKRLSDRLMRDVSRVYDNQQVTFQARWFPVMFLLADHKHLAVTEIATMLGMTHPAINQVANQMTKAGYLLSGKDKSDERRRLLYLSKKGENLLKELIPLWDVIRVSNQELIDSVSFDLFAALDKIEAELDNKDMYQRVTAKLQQTRVKKIDIIPYKTSLKKHFAELNTQWLTQYFTLEPTDVNYLEQPEKMILQPGGQIFFAKMENTIIGTTALIKHDPDTHEIAKMAVAPKYRGQGAGKKLLMTALDSALNAGGKNIYLLTNAKLKEAGHLYEQAGFELFEWKRNPYAYQRNTYSMKLNLKKYRTFKTKELAV